MYGWHTWQEHARAAICCCFPAFLPACFPACSPACLPAHTVPSALCILLNRITHSNMTLRELQHTHWACHCQAHMHACMRCSMQPQVLLLLLLLLPHPSLFLKEVVFHRRLLFFVEVVVAFCLDPSHVLCVCAHHILLCATCLVLEALYDPSRSMHPCNSQNTLTALKTLTLGFRVYYFLMLVD
jgi:hypothetical protein